MTDPKTKAVGNDCDGRDETKLKWVCGIGWWYDKSCPYKTSLKCDLPNDKFCAWRKKGVVQ